jgi:hypothetical protein
VPPLFASAPKVTREPSKDSATSSRLTPTVSSILASAPRLSSEPSKEFAVGHNSTPSTTDKSTDKEINVLVIVPDRPVEIQAFDSSTELSIVESRIRSRSSLVGGGLIHFDSLRAVKDGKVPGGNYRFVGGTALALAGVVTPTQAASSSHGIASLDAAGKSRAVSVSGSMYEIPLVPVKSEIIHARDAGQLTHQAQGSDNGIRNQGYRAPAGVGLVKPIQSLPQAQNPYNGINRAINPVWQHQQQPPPPPPLHPPSGQHIANNSNSNSNNNGQQRDVFYNRNKGGR